MALSLVSALLLLLLKDVTCQNLPYRTITNRNDGSNNITLRCIDRFGVEVPGASFYRNGQQPITNNSCLMAYPTGSSSELRITLVSQECDGYLSCGVNGTLSEPVALYACPVKNNSLTGRTELVEEGTSVLLTCDFYPSPINRYRTTWYRSPGRFQTELNRSMDFQSYTENNPRQMTTYACEIDPVHDCFNNAASPTGPIITIHLKERYVMPMITKDLNYTRQNSGSGGVFSVSTSGTNLTHKWYKNDKLINGTGAGILAFGNDALTVEDSNGLLRITYEASNVDYDNMTQTTRQTFGLYTNVSQGVNCVNITREIIINPTTACNQSDSVSTTALAASLAVCFFLFISSIIVCIILLSLLLYRTRHRTDKNTIALTNTTSDKNVESKNPAQNTAGGPTPDAGPTNINLTYQPNRFLQNGCNEMLHCKNNYEFLLCLKVILNAASGHKEFNKDCGELFTRLSNEIDAHMMEIEPQGKDGGKKNVACDGDTQNCHIVYTHWEEITQTILKDLGYTE